MYNINFNIKNYKEIRSAKINAFLERELWLFSEQI